ncbi:MAG: hypothetical protein WCP06_12735 [Verrucomicrobiota bacterium]
MLVCAGRPANAQLSVLAAKPDWSDLAPYQNTITHDDFLRLLNTVYAPDGAWKGTIDVRSDAAIIHSSGKSDVLFRLEFAKNAASAKPVPRYWTPAGRRAVVPGKPLQGYTIALDPGHLGGEWAKMEERWFQIGNAKPVMEGEMTLAVARLLSARLSALGANVSMVRNSTEPVTSARPRGLQGVARTELKREGVTKIRNNYDGPNDPLKFNSVRWQSELLFYRVSEIRSRAELVNQRIKPDLAICLHLNAEDWGNPAQPSLTDKNHLHLLVNGNCGPGELGFEDIRHNMLQKLLSRSAREEFPLSGRVAASLASATGLPAYEYFSGKARRVTDNPYVWARNLLANRLYLCPVVYCEPYVMNSKAVFDRVQMGDYEGTKLVDGVPRKSIYREYADAVAEGVASYFISKEQK